MKIFISWSGERSRLVGELLDEWLQCVIQVINPWRSDRDIDRGSMWFTQITNQLQETSLGIVCITQENKDSRWILFESGALSKGLSSNRVFTFLIDLEPKDIEDPLAQFNHTMPNKVGVKGLVKTLNSTLEEKAIPDKILDKVFETYWPQFEESFKAIIEGTPEKENIEVRSDKDILSEILDRTRAMDRRISRVERDNMKSEQNEIDNGFIRNPISKRELDSRIRNLSENGKSLNEIIEIISEKYSVPTSVIVNILKDHLVEKNNVESHI